MKKQLVSILFALCMVLCLVPLAAFAEESTETPPECSCETSCTAESMNSEYPLCAADGAIYVHFFRCAGRFADARGQVFPAVLGKGCGGQHRQCHDEHKQNTAQSFLHGDSPLSSGVSRPPWEARCQKGIAS